MPPKQCLWVHRGCVVGAWRGKSREVVQRLDLAR